MSFPYEKLKDIGYYASVLDIEWELSFVKNTHYIKFPKYDFTWEVPDYYEFNPPEMLAALTALVLKDKK